MPRKFFKKYSPDPQVIREHKLLKVFGNLLHDPNLWHLNRKSVPGAFALGLFMAFVPLPSQMIVSAAFAIVFRVNLPISVGTVWISNPLTIPPLFYFCYWLGAQMMGINTVLENPQWTWEWFKEEIWDIWQPLLLGCFAVGTTSALVGYFTVAGLWRLKLVRVIQRRKEQREMNREKQNKSQNNPS